MLAGAIVLISVVLTILVTPWWLALTRLMGLNFFQLHRPLPAETVLRHFCAEASCGSSN